jgi:hypothetical protein
VKIVRAKNRRKFLVVRQEVVNDDRLSFRARGILLWLLEKPDGWNTNSVDIAAAGREGREAIRTAMRELEQVGYLARKKQQDARGHWETVCVVHEVPKTGSRSSVNRPSAR